MVLNTKPPPTPGCAPFTYGARVISTIGTTGRSLYKVGNAGEAFIPRMLLAQSVSGDHYTGIEM